MKVSLAFHIVGIVFWLGGVILLPRILKSFVEAPALIPAGGAAIKKVFTTFIVPGAIITLATGIFQLLEGGGVAFYMKQHWFHGKATFIIVVLVATVLLNFEVEKVARGIVPSRAKLGAIHGLAAHSLIVISYMTLTGR